MAILGVDPGLEGGLCLLWPDGILIEPMMEPEELRRWLHHWRPEITLAVLEEPGMRPGQATQSTMKVGRSFGRIEGLLLGIGIRYETVRPETWSAAFPHGIQEKDRDKRYKAIKAKRKEIAQELFPNIDFRASERCTTAHSGMIEAALIAVYASRSKGLT